MLNGLSPLEKNNIKLVKKRGGRNPSPFLSIFKYFEEWGVNMMITTKMIRESKPLTLSLHREMWTWLADNPSKRKEDWPRWNAEVQVCKSYCFLCEFSQNKGGCCSCPVKWPSTSPTVFCVFSTTMDWASGMPDISNGLYNLWRCEDNINLRARYARRISNLAPKF